VASEIGIKYITVKEVKTSGSTLEWVYGLNSSIKPQNIRLPIPQNAPISLKNFTVFPPNKSPFYYLYSIELGKTLFLMIGKKGAATLCHSTN
jgi:hypothetical protein